MPFRSRRSPRRHSRLSPLFQVVDGIGIASFAYYALQQAASALLPRPELPVAQSGVGMTFLIPALNEAQVIRPTILNLRATVPDARIVVIDDASDDGTDRIVRELAAGDSRVQLLRREFPNARQNKGKAMNWAVSQLLNTPEFRSLNLNEEVFIGIDADGRVGPDFAPQVRGAFRDPHVMAAQGWMRYRQEAAHLTGMQGALAKLLLIHQDLENFIVGHDQRLRHRAGVASLTGNGQCMRASYVARQLERGKLPWPDVLLEDFASALEVTLEDPRNRIATLSAQVGQQGMLEPSPLIRQRVRWTQGTMETLPYLPRLLKSGTNPAIKVDFTFMIVAPWMMTLMAVASLFTPLRAARNVQGVRMPGWWGRAVATLPLLYQIGWSVLYTRERRLPWRTVPYLMLTFPVYRAITLVSLPLALKRHATGEKGWYKSVRHDEPTSGQTGQ